MKLDDETCATLRSLQPLIERELPKALDTLYDMVRATPQTRRLFSTDAHLAQAKKAQLRHWEAIASGRFDAAYEAAVRRIGQAHVRIGLEPSWYIGAYSLISGHLLRAVVTERWPTSLIARGGQRRAGDDVGKALTALSAAIFLDMDLSITIYLEEIDAVRLAGEAALEEERARVVGTIGEALSRLSEKDLTWRVDEHLPGAYEKLRDDYNSAVEQLGVAFSGVAASSAAVQSGTQQIAIASNDLSRRTEQQASSLEETAAALDQITATVRKSAEGAREAHQVVGAAREQAHRGGEVVRRAVEAMVKIEKSSQQISHIIGVIDEIAFQTNLLALNAGVEAARAGDAGRGFAVVASEVRALAQRSAEAAKEIKGLISGSTQHVQAGVELVAESGRALARIEEKVSEMDAAVEAIAASAQEQASSLQQVNVAVGHMDQVTQQNAAMSEQANAASQSLEQECAELGRLLGDFTLADAASTASAGTDLREALQKAAPHAFRAPAPAPAPARGEPRRAARAAAGGGRAAAPEADAGDWKEF